jgi:Mg2+-importing ATPase
MRQGTGPQLPLALRDAASMEVSGVFSALQSAPDGIPSDRVALRRAQFGPNAFGQRRLTAGSILLRQLGNPLLVLLVVTALASLLLGEHADAYIIVGILGISVGLGFFNEYRSERAMIDLTKRVRHHTIAIRDAKKSSVDVTELVPGDVVQIGVGDIVPADLRLLETNQLECDQSVLTGESMPAEKSSIPAAPNLPLTECACCAFMGTTVKAGSATGIVVATGALTMFGGIAAHLAVHPPETAFAAGLRRFSGLLVRVTAVLTVSIFAVNAALHHPLLDSLLFSLAIAVGLTPQLLPAIITLSLATGAERLARRSVVVKRLLSIEDLGNIDTLFTDKTGTLTEGAIAFQEAIDDRGDPSTGVLLLGLACNEAEVREREIVGGNALDAALWQHALASGTSSSGYARLAEVPFDYDRKRMSVLVENERGEKLIVVKGAPEAVLERCGRTDPGAQSVADRLFDEGRRVVAVASRVFEGTAITANDERDLVLRGHLRRSRENRRA